MKHQARDGNQYLLMMVLPDRKHYVYTVDEFTTTDEGLICFVDKRTNITKIVKTNYFEASLLTPDQLIKKGERA